MQKRLSFLAAGLALLVLLSCLLGACSKQSVALTYRDGAFRSANGKLAFREAPAIYYALSALTNDEIAVIRRDGMSDIPLYEIEHCSTARYLADASLFLYYAEGETLPTLAELGASRIALYQYSDNRVMRQLVSTLEDADRVSDLVGLAVDGVKIPAQKVTGELYHRMELLFLSNSYAGFGMMLEYRKLVEELAVYAPLNTDGSAPDLYPGVTPTVETVAGEQVAVWRLGTNFIYDSVAQTYTPVWDVLENYFIGDSETETAE